VKPPDAKPAVWGRFPESVGKTPHLSDSRDVRLLITFNLPNRWRQDNICASTFLVTEIAFRATLRNSHCPS
jgi:hypothetical protein